MLDATTSLNKLYKHVETKDLTKQYVLGHPLIHVAIECKCNELLQENLGNKNDELTKTLLASTNKDKDTPIHCAARNGNAVAIEIISASNFIPLGQISG